MIIPLILAAAFEFTGILGQSAAPSADPVGFLGAMAVTDGPDGRIWLIGDDNGLYSIIKDALSPRHCTAPSSCQSLFNDGRRLWIVGGGGEGVWPVDISAAGKPKIGGCIAPEVSMRGGTARPEKPCHPFASKGKFFALDQNRKTIVGLDEGGRKVADIAPFPCLSRPSPTEGLGFLPETGQLVAVTGYPDARIYRFNPDGHRDDTCGWPVFRGYGSLLLRSGELYHLYGKEVIRLKKNYTETGVERLDIGPEDSTRGYAIDRTTGYRYVASYQGLKFAKPGEDGFPHRIGGMAKALTTLALDHGAVLFSAGGERIRQLWLDDAADTPFSSDDSLANIYSWTDAPTSLSPFGTRYFASVGRIGPSLFMYWPEADTNHGRRRWRDFEFSPELEKGQSTSAIAADFLTREIFFTWGAKLYRTVYPLSNDKKMKIVLAEVANPAGAKIEFLARASESDAVVFATETAFGAFNASDGRLLWSKPAAGKVAGLAASGPAAAVSDETGLKLYSAQTGEESSVLDQASVPGGYVSGRVAAEGQYIVLEDRRGRRLLRLSVK
ncbi:MAG: hypothetical protein PHV28_11430 [Kiritimatiellae bacterium]|nr:hypothetical protein [Kiritimatiellia bacterium]